MISRSKRFVLHMMIMGLSAIAAIIFGGLSIFYPEDAFYIFLLATSLITMVLSFRNALVVVNEGFDDE